MKLNKLFIGAIAALASAAMVACSDDAPDVNNGGENQDGEAKYLSVKIISNNTGSRSTADGYEDGEAYENRVKTVRFYFFNAAGDPVNVKNGSTNNFYNWTAPTTVDGGGAIDPNVEKTLNAVIVVDTKAGDRLPELIFAVINPEATGLDDSRLNLENLRLKYADYAGKANTTVITDETATNFVMSNSVYANSSRTEVFKATKVQVSDFKSDETTAKNNPVEIYVERTMAKVRAHYNTSLNITNGLIQATTKPATGQTTGEPITIINGDTRTNVYIKVKGWNVTSTLPAANLSKHINLSWNDNYLAESTPWNHPGYFRSYWAEENQIGDQKKNVNITWEQANKTVSSSTHVYVNENAERIGESNLEPTYIMVSANLCDANGNNFTVVDYAGLKFVDNSNLTGLKTMVLNYLNNGEHSHYKAVSENGTTKYVKIAPEDITFTQNTTAQKDKYTVTAVLTNTAASYSWYTALSEASEITDVAQLTPLGENGASEINNHLRQQQTAMVYTDGATYFYAPIEHFSKNGIVRNHIYDITISGFYGLGTPVYKSDEIIFPEKPQDTQAYLAARIRILSWRLMSQDVTFE